MVVAIEQVEALDIDTRVGEAARSSAVGRVASPTSRSCAASACASMRFFKLRGLHSRSSRHTAYLHIDINSAVSIVEIAAHMHVSALSRCL